jgi:hypothetical protein
VKQYDNGRNEAFFVLVSGVLLDDKSSITVESEEADMHWSRLALE